MAFRIRTEKFPGRIPQVLPEQCCWQNLISIKSVGQVARECHSMEDSSRMTVIKEPHVEYFSIQLVVYQDI